MKNQVEHTAIFFYSVLCLCIAYLVCEYFFIPAIALSSDEFIFARHIYDYTVHLPYRDFPPYKTVLGYYLLSLPFFFSHALLTPLFYIKDEIALLNMIFLLAACHLARYFFDKKAIWLVVLALFANQLFLVYSVDLRVDMLTSWVCLFVALFLLQYRFTIAGLLLGTAFLISQKALWTVVAANGAMLMCHFISSHSRYTWRAITHVNMAALLTIAIYIIVWAWVAGSLQMVWHNLFYEAYIQAGIDFYLPIYLSCWQVIFLHGPFLFFIFPFAFFCLSYSAVLSERSLFIISFSFLILLQFIHYLQPFPYNVVFVLPAFFLLYAEFFSWLMAKNHDSTRSVFLNNNPYFTAIFLFFYAFLIVMVSQLLSLSALAYLIAFFPLAVVGMMHSRDKVFKQGCFYAAFFIFILTGVLQPLYESIMTIPAVDGRYQQNMMQVSAALLADHGHYVGGVPFLYLHDQPIDGMKNLIGPAVQYLETPTAALKPLLLSSLYLSPVSMQKVIQDFEKQPVKLIINNYRMMILPVSLKDYLNQHYSHFYGSLYLYAPAVKATDKHIQLFFTGWYRVQGADKKIVFIDGKRIITGQTVSLNQGSHRIKSSSPFRLMWLPQHPLPLNNAYQKDNWLKMLRAILS